MAVYVRKPKRKKTQEEPGEEKGSSSSTFGKWKPEEHERLLEALELYGNSWSKVQEYVGTRSRPQIRSHAQKYYAMQRKKVLQDLMNSGEIENTVFLVVKEYRNCTSDSSLPTTAPSNGSSDLPSEGQRTFCSPQQSLHSESSIGQEPQEPFSNSADSDLSEDEDNEQDGNPANKKEAQDAGISFVGEDCPLPQKKSMDRDNEIEIMSLVSTELGDKPAVEFSLPLGRHVPNVEDASALLK
jgi:SHAQKYF class myb-like DNA-binding protein